METRALLFKVAVILAVLSLLNIPLDIMPNRWLRILTSGIFFLIAVKIVGLAKPFGLLIFGSLVFCDFLLLKWEVVFAKYVYYSLHSLIILTLMIMIIKEMNWRRISSFDIGSAMGFLFFSSLILLALSDFLSTDNILIKTLFYVNGSSMVLLVVLAFFNSISNHDVLAPSLFLGILALVLSELMLFVIYFLEVPEFRFIDNFFYCIALFFLLKVSLENKLRKNLT